MKEITVVGSVNHQDVWYKKASQEVNDFVVGAVRTGEIYMSDVKSMVTRVTAQADGDKITRLNIIDHGNTDHAMFGQDCITTSSFEIFAPLLGMLSRLFEKSAIVHLQHCRVGQNQDLLRMFAGIFGVAVYAGTDDHNSAARFNWGEYVRCSPSGTIYNDVLRP